MGLGKYTPQIKRASQDDIMGALDAAKMDGCTVNTMPSHVVKNGEEYIGYWSLGAIPLIWAWHKKDMNVRQTLHAFSTVDAIMSDRGTPNYIVPLEPFSPYCPLMEKMGYRKIGESILYIKEDE